MHVAPDGSIIYRSGMNPKINANFRIFTPLDFIAAISDPRQELPACPLQ